MTTAFFRLGIPLVSALSLSGCLEVALVQALDRDDEESIPESGGFESEPVADEGFEDSEFFDDVDYEQTDALDVRSARLSGDMGEVRGFDDADPMMNGYAYDGYVSIELHAEASDGAAMAILTVEGAMALEPGDHVDSSTNDTGELYVDMLGCSGPADYDWEFDQYATSVTVDVTEGVEPGTRTLVFSGTYSDESTVTGTVELGPLQAQ
jgi:hypothetical protein